MVTDKSQNPKDFLSRFNVHRGHPSTVHVAISVTLANEDVRSGRVGARPQDIRNQSAVQDHHDIASRGPRRAEPERARSQLERGVATASELGRKPLVLVARRWVL